MKEEKRAVVFFIIVIVGFISIYGALTYLCSHPEVRNISHYDDPDYYICNAITGSGRSREFHFGAVSKEDYEHWINGDSNTIWVVSSRDVNRGWRLNISSITTIELYPHGEWIPLFK